MAISFSFVLVHLSLAIASVYGTPLPQPPAKGALMPAPVNNPGPLCQIPIIKTYLCPQPVRAVSSTSVSTPIGTAQGVQDQAGATRFSVKYASASRWQSSSVATTWSFPNGASNASALPLTCPQSGVDDSTFSEDCLSMILYVPPTAQPTSKLPIMMWIHGGSFVLGSATDPGLDGSNMATATDAIIAVVQYRLGALGFMAPSGSTNLAVSDIVTALNFLHKVGPSFGGDVSKITLAGQSSGANMIRALLAVPQASSLFSQGIIQSDPMDFGFLSTATQSTMQNYFNGLLSCSSSDTACLNSLSLDTILDAQSQLADNAADITDGSPGTAEPIRPVHDGSLISSPLDSTAAFPSQSKPLIISTVLNEAAFTIYNMFGQSLAASNFAPAVAGTFDSKRTQEIVNSSFYQMQSGSDSRVQLDTLGTDYLWKCSSWTFARNWVNAGGKAFVGLYQLGASYPGNSAVSFCTQPGVVCHQDDIEIVFGTVPSPTPAQAALVTEMQARYKAFLSGGNPNALGFEPWTAAGTSNVNAKNLGATGLAPINACIPTFWGATPQYDYQVFDI